MGIPVLPAPGDGPAGWSYAGVIVRSTRDRLLPLLADLRVSGWIGPDERGWVVVVTKQSSGAVAGARRDLAAVAAEIAVRLTTVALAASVRADTLLVLTMWDGEREVGRYVSDPSAVTPQDDEALDEPEGAWYAAAFLRACRDGDPDADFPHWEQAAAELEEILAERLDTDSVFESERLARVLSLLGMPAWLVSSASLPKDVPGGPAGNEVLRLGSGRTGLSGRLADSVVGAVRRRRGPRPT